MNMVAKFVTAMLRDEERSRSVVAVVAGALGLATMLFAAVAIVTKTGGK